MSILNRFLSRPRPTSAPSRRDDRARRRPGFQVSPLERCEDRVVLSTVTLLPLGTGTLNGTAQALSTTIGFSAAVPRLSGDGNSILFSFTNAGSSPVTVGLATYSSHSTGTPVNLTQQKLLGVDYVTIPAASCGKPTTYTACEPAKECEQIDTFINKVGCKFESCAPTGFTAVDQINPGPPTDAGFNTAGVHGPTLAAGQYGTLLSYTQTSCPPAGKPPGDCGGGGDNGDDDNGDDGDCGDGEGHSNGCDNQGSKDRKDRKDKGGNCHG